MNLICVELFVVICTALKISDIFPQVELYLRRVADLDAVTEIRNQQRSDLERFVKMRVSEFLDGFYKITYKLKEIYQMITLGGDAELELVDSLNPFSEGIMFR